MSNGSNTLHNNLSSRRILTFVALLIIIFFAYLIRLFFLQIIQQSDWVARAEENRIREINFPAPRGIIYDRNGIVLARNIPSYNIVITPSNLPDDQSEIQQIYREIATLTGMPINRGEISTENPYVPCISDHGIVQIVTYGETSAPFTPVRIKCDVDRQTAMIVKEKAVDWPGVDVEVVPVRDYPTGSLTANFIGYLGPISAQTEAKYRALGFLPDRDKVGYTGLEYWFQDELAGRNGLDTVEVDAAGKILRNVTEPIAPTPGKNIRLTIDTRLQQAAEAILIDEINYWNRRVISENKLMTSGVVIAINPKTGEILAMVSYPTYENNRLARFIPEYYYQQLSLDSRVPLLNHAVGDELPIGSVFKIVTATGGLNEAVITPEEIIKTPGKITLTEKYYANDPGRAREFVDWNWQTGGFGQLDFIHAVANSSNVYFYKVGGGYQDEVPQGLGICRLGTYARALGYAETPEIELPDKTNGLIPDPTWKRINQGESWSTGDTYIASVGQGYIIGTPLQVLLSVSTVANNGKLMKPTLLREMLDSDGNITQSFTPQMRWDLTQEAEIQVYAENSIRGCEQLNEKKTVQPWVFKKIQEGMRLAVLEGTLKDTGLKDLNIAVAGKTGTAEYCDKFALAKDLCKPGNWPTHAWTVAFAPLDDPEIALVAFVYNGNEGSTVAGPIISRVMQAYFEIKAVDAGVGGP
jgi:penicillin-binding protein 2